MQRFPLNENKLGIKQMHTLDYYLQKKQTCVYWSLYLDNNSSITLRVWCPHKLHFFFSFQLETRVIDLFEIEIFLLSLQLSKQYKIDLSACSKYELFKEGEKGIQSLTGINFQSSCNLLHELNYESMLKL